MDNSPKPSYPDRYECNAGDGPGVYIERDDKGDMMYADEAITFIDKLRAELADAKTAIELLNTSSELLQRTCDGYAKEVDTLQGIRKLMGHVENGTETTVKLFQDDATHSYHVKLGNKPLGPSYWGDTLGEAVARAVKNTPDD